MGQRVLLHGYGGVVLWVHDLRSLRPKGSSGLPVAPARDLGDRDAPTRGKTSPTWSLTLAIV